MKGQLLQDTPDITLDQPTKTIANDQGMSLLREVRQLADQLEKSKAEHEKRIRQLEAANPVDDRRLIRAAALDEWAGLPNQTDYRLPERNIVAHGGRLRLDVDTIQSLEPLQPERISAWKNAFKTQYGLPYHWVVPELDSIPEQVITVMDRRASAHIMRHWQKKTDLQSDVLRCANEINVAWWERREKALEEPAVIALLKELEECWTKGQCD